MIENQNVPTSIRCLATDSPPINLSPVTLFRYRFSPRRIFFRIDSPPGDYILKQSLRGEKLFHPPLEINSPPGESLFRRELGYSRIAFIVNQSTLFWLTHLYPNYALFSSRNKQNIKRLEFFCE